MCVVVCVMAGMQSRNSFIRSPPHGRGLPRPPRSSAYYISYFGLLKEFYRRELNWTIGYYISTSTGKQIFLHYYKKSPGPDINGQKHPFQV